MTRTLTAALLLGLATFAVPRGAPAEEPPTEEKRGCCSHHKGVCGCIDGSVKCCDGSFSPTCGC